MKASEETATAGSRALVCADLRFAGARRRQGGQRC